MRDPGEEIRQKKWAESHQISQTMKRAASAQLSKEKRYIFDRTFDSLTDTRTLYCQSVQVISNCINESESLWKLYFRMK